MAFHPGAYKARMRRFRSASPRLQLRAGMLAVNLKQVMHSMTPAHGKSRPHYFHAIPCAGLPHAAKCSTAEIQFIGRKKKKNKTVPQRKTDYTF